MNKINKFPRIDEYDGMGFVFAIAWNAAPSTFFFNKLAQHMFSLFFQHFNCQVDLLLRDSRFYNQQLPFYLKLPESQIENGDCNC